MDANVVSSLEDLAFKVSFKYIMDTLTLCSHKSEGVHSTCPCRLLIRSCLDKHLVGLKSQIVRGKYLKSFYDTANTWLQGKFPVEVWIYLDAVLDSSIKDLEIHAIAFPNSLPRSELIPIITKWSPLLEKLTINFVANAGYFPYDGNRMGQSKELMFTIRSLRSLQHLTNLSLLQTSPRVRFTVLTLIGKACPLLSHLTVCGRLLDKRDILALILGETVNNLFDFEEFHTRKLPPWCEDRALEHLLVPSEYLSPICSTLRELQVTRDHGVYDDNNQVFTPEAVFALRHLPFLRATDALFPVSVAITFLHLNGRNTTEERKSLEKFRNALERSGNGPTTPRNLSISFSGQILLTRLYSVNVMYGDMMRAVGAMFPILKEAFFCTQSYKSDVHGDYSNRINLTSVINPGELKSIINQWPKLTTIGFVKVPLWYITPILEVFGPGLQHLEFSDCLEIKLADLALCTQLESLRIFTDDDLDVVTLIPQEVDSSFEAATFLPQLKSFHSQSCLGRHSRLFEEKSSLVRLVLNCSHLKIEAEPIHKRLSTLSVQASSCFGLDRIRESWSQLEVLAIWQFAQLSLPLMSDLIPHLRNLKLVTLPGNIKSNDPTLFRSIRDHLLGRNPPAKINLARRSYDATCKLVNNS